MKQKTNTIKQSGKAWAEIDDADNVLIHFTKPKDMIGVRKVNYRNRSASSIEIEITVHGTLEWITIRQK